jgi:CheY-like chemotaxis protein
VLRLVGTASDGPSGLRTVLDARPAVAIVDLDLPGFDGLEVSRRIHEEAGADAPRVVMWSGKDAPSDDALRTAGVDAFVRKDAGLPPLLAATAC